MKLLALLALAPFGLAGCSSEQRSLDAGADGALPPWEGDPGEGSADAGSPTPADLQPTDAAAPDPAAPMRPRAMRPQPTPPRSRTAAPRAPVRTSTSAPTSRRGTSCPSTPGAGPRA